MGIDLTQDLAGKLIVRVQKEYGETCVANFTLEIMNQELHARFIESEIKNAKLQELNEALAARNTDLIKSLNEANESKLELLRASAKPQKVVKRANGTHPNQ